MEDHLKIFLPTDYSDAALNAERYAVQLAKNINAVVVFFHVYQLPYNSPSDPQEFVRNSEELYRSELKRLKEHSEELFTSLQINANELTCEYLISEGGNVEKQIIREAEQLNANFIIVGTHGVGGFRKLFFGSKSWGVIKKSNRPVFAIPKGASFSGIRNIVFGTEYRNGEISGLSFLVDFARMFNAEVTVLHITNYILTKNFEREMFQKFRAEVADRLLYPKLKMQLMVNENVSEGVNKFCIENKTDLLVMSPRKPLIFENYFLTNMSMTRKTIFHTGIPLLTIPDFYKSEHWMHEEAEDSGVLVDKKN